jgi:sodium-dependent dicarboxylate transporter 2/3/5
MAVTGLLSAWMSNTATAMLMVPIAIAVIGLVPDEKRRTRFGVCLMLAVAYSASLGGMATLVGTPPNAVLASLAKSLAGVDVSFVQWMAIAAPVSALSIFLAWLYLVHVGARSGDAPVAESKKAVSEMLAGLGRMAGDEKAVLAVFGGTAVAWVTRGLFWGSALPMVNDSVIAIAAAILLFVIPARSKDAQERKPLLDWHTATKIPWGVLVLMGGGLSLAGAFTATGLDAWIAGNLLFLEGLNYFVIVIAVAAVAVFVSEIISNTATVALLIPVVAALAGALSIDPILLMVPVALVNAYGFMMPAGTPPNAIVFASGYVTVRKMARTGIVLDLMGIVLVSTFAYFLLPLVW